MLAEAQLATGDAVTALRTVRRCCLIACWRASASLNLPCAPAKAAGDPAAGALQTRLKAPQLAQIQSLAAAGQAALTRQDWTRGAGRLSPDSGL